MDLALIPTAHSFEQGSATDGVAVTSYGQGQLTGATYTVPAHGQIDVEFSLKLQCVTPDDIKAMDELIRSLLKASEQHKYDNLNKTSVSGGISFFAFWSGGVKADTTNTNHTMTKWGLSEKNQEKIVDKMMQLAMKMSTFKYKGTVYNKDFDYAVSGNLFGIVMDCTIQQGTSSNQVRCLAPKAHLTDESGAAALPATGKLY